MAILPSPSTLLNQKVKIGVTLAQKKNSPPFHLQIFKCRDGVQERPITKLVGYSNEPHYLPVLHLVILKFANERARSFFFRGVY